MNENENEPESALCAICGTEHDPTEIPELDSTHLCVSCAIAELRVRHSPLVFVNTKHPLHLRRST